MKVGGRAVGGPRHDTPCTAAGLVVRPTAAPHSVLSAEEVAHAMQARAGRPLLLFDIAGYGPKTFLPELDCILADELLKVHVSYGPLAQRLLTKINGLRPHPTATAGAGAGGVWLMEPSCSRQGGRGQVAAIAEHGGVGRAAADIDGGHLGVVVGGPARDARAAPGDLGLGVGASDGDDEVAGRGREGGEDGVGVARARGLTGDDHGTGLDCGSVDARQGIVAGHEIGEALRLRQDQRAHVIENLPAMGERCGGPGGEGRRRRGHRRRGLRAVESRARAHHLSLIHISEPTNPY